MTIFNKISSYINFGRKALKSNDGKTLAENFTYLSLLQIASYLFPFITIPYLSRVIGVDGFGRIAFAAAIIMWIQTIVDWGFGYTATREIAKNRENKDIVSFVYSNVIWAKMLIAAICFVVLIVLISLIPILHQNSKVLLYTFLLIPGYILFPDWLFQGMEKMKFTTIFNIAIKFAFTIAIFFVIKQPDDYVFQPLLTSIGFMVSGIIAYFLIRNKWGIRLKAPNLTEIRRWIKESFDIFIGNLFPTMYTNFTAVLLGAIGSPTANGLYDGGNKFANIGQQLMAVVGRTFYPYLNRNADKHSLYARINLSLSAITSILLFIASPLLVHWFLTPEFEESIIVLRVLSISIFFLTFGTVYCVNYLFVKGYDREARNMTIIASIIGFLLAYPMIKWFGCIGAAINVTLTRAIMGILYLVAANKHMKQCA